MKIRPVGAKLFHADGQTDMKKLTVNSHNFANEPKNEEFEYFKQYSHCPTYVMVAFRGTLSKSKFTISRYLLKLISIQFLYFTRKKNYKRVLRNVQ
jgi:hypothetical protein